MGHERPEWRQDDGFGATLASGADLPAAVEDEEGLHPGALTGSSPAGPVRGVPLERLRPEEVKRIREAFASNRRALLPPDIRGAAGPRERHENERTRAVLAALVLTRRELLAPGSPLSQGDKRLHRRPLPVRTAGPVEQLIDFSKYSVGLLGGLNRPSRRP